MPRVAARFAAFPRYPLADVPEIKRKLKAEGVDVIDLGAGDADMPPPGAAVAALQASAGVTEMSRYPFQLGLPSFRAAVAAWMERRFGVKLDPLTELLPLIGSKEGIGHIHLAFVEPGDEVLIPDPGYPTYQGGTILAGGTPRYYPLRAETGWLPDLAELERQDLSRVKLMHINYPSNPTTASADLECFAAVAAFGLRHNIIICHDNAYSEVYFDGVRPPSFLQAKDAKKIGIEFHSLSKTYLMTGWRIGVAVGHADVIAALGDVKSNYETGIFPVVQQAGVAALTGDQSLLETMRRHFQQRRDLFADGLARLGYLVQKPKATFYVWARTPKGLSSMDTVTHIFDQVGVMCTPGNGFGPSGEGYVRFALTVDQPRLEEAVQRLSH